MKKLAIKEYEKPFTLYEESQTSGIKFAFVSAPKDGTAQCHPLVKCRDFLHDAVRAYLTNTKCDIYGFKYDPALDPPIDTRRIRMHLQYVSKDGKPFAPIIEKALKLVNHYEEKMDSKSKTSAKRIDDNSYLVSGPSIWLKSPILTTFFSLLFRLAENIGDFEKGNTKNLTEVYETAIKDFPENKDVRYLKVIYKNLAVITEYYKDLCNLYNNAYDPIIFAQDSISNYHNYAGIVSLCKGHYVDKSKAELLKTLEEEYKEGKELLRVKAIAPLSPYSSYQPHEVGLAFVNVENDIRKQCTTFTGCRESLTYAFRNRHAEADHLPHWGTHQNKVYVDDEKLRLLVRIPGVRRDRVRMILHKKEMFFAKRVLNYYEKTLGITKSVISTVVLEHDNGVQYAWLFTSSKDWLVSPVMLSIYVTIIRSAKAFMYNHGLTPEKFEMPENINGKTVNQMWKVLYDNKKFSKMFDSEIHTAASGFALVLKNRDVLFGKRTVKEQHFIGKENILPGETIVGYNTKVGISALLSHSHIDKKLLNTYKELKK